jgi:hypothetical protein
MERLNRNNKQNRNAASTNLTPETFFKESFVAFVFFVVLFHFTKTKTVTQTEKAQHLFFS